MLPSHVSAPHLAAMALCCTLSATATSGAVAEQKRSYNLPAGDAATTLNQFAGASGQHMIFMMDKVRGERTNTVRGELTAREALDRMLTGTALSASRDPATGAFVVSRKRRATSQKEEVDSEQSRAPPAGSPAAPPDQPKTVQLTSPVNSRNTTPLRRSWLASLIALAGATFAPAQSPAVSKGTTVAASPDRGSIAGRVINAATGAYLEGAQVRLDPGPASTLTSRDGHFLFSNLNPGDYRVTISYTGLDTQSLPVTVSPDRGARTEVVLTSRIYSMEAFTVAGEREGNALAITQQRNAPNVKNVLSSDAFGNIADQNIGNLLTQLPGISEFIDDGEVTRVNIRGISPDMNAVTVDGTRGANATTGTLDRGFSLDRIPADFVERIEVTKALTPDMDGDSIGGAINLKTKSPLDRKGRHITYMVGSSYNIARDTYEPIASASFSDIFGAEEKLGVLVTTSYNKTHKPRDVIYLNWEATLETNRPAFFWISNLGEDLLKHERTGLGVRFDYKLSPTHRVFVNTMYSFYQDTMDRRQQSLSAPTASSVRSGWTDTITETLNQQVSFTQNHRKRTVETINVAFGGEKRFSSSFLDYGFNYSGSSGTEDRVIPTRIVDGRAGFRFDRSRSAKLPSVEQISGPDILDLNNQRISTLNFQDFDDTDTIKGAHVNWRRRFVTAAPTSLKMGLRYRGQEREREQLRSYYVHVGADGVAGLNPATRVNDDNVARFIDEGYRYRPAGGLYERFGTYIDPVRLVQDWRANPSHYTLNVANTARDSLQFNGAVSENICAAYLMGDINLGRLDILGGFRVEDTYLKGTGVRQEITPAERARRAAWVGTVTPQELERRTIAEWSNLREEGGNYRSLLPSLHFKYSLSNNMLGRLSYSTGIGRPNFIDLLRTTTVNHDTMTVVAANPNLRPQYADNFDFSLEYYFEPAGFVSAGVFLKEIKDFIYGDRAGVVPAGEDNGFDGDYVGYDLSSQFNGGSARVRGFELAYQQRLVWLPGFWKGLGLMANYTRLESRGNYDASGKVTGAELDNFVPESMNLGLSYAYHKWDIRVKMNYRGGSLYAYSSNPLLSNHRFAKRNYDLNLKYNWATRLSFFVDVINVFNTPLNDTYLYVPKRNRFTQVFTTAIKAGVSGRF